MRGVPVAGALLFLLLPAAGAPAGAIEAPAAQPDTDAKKELTPLQLVFTIVIEGISFLVLVYILHRLLYKPVAAMLRGRQERIETDRTEAERARTLSDLYTTSVLPQARAAVESAISAYRVGGVDYMTLVANQMTVNRYAIRTVRLIADHHRAVAQIEALVGGDIGGNR